MDAEIRRLTYVPRFAGSKPADVTPRGVESFMGDLPALFQKSELSKPVARAGEVRLEARLIEMERERSESERRHREEIEAAHQKAAETLAMALKEQKETLVQEHAGSLRAALTNFHESQRRYFDDCEAGVVRHALSIASRVLNREAQVEPLLLRGAVCV